MKLVTTLTAKRGTTKSVIRIETRRESKYSNHETKQNHELLVNEAHALLAQRYNVREIKLS